MKTNKVYPKDENCQILVIYSDGAANVSCYSDEDVEETWKDVVVWDYVPDIKNGIGIQTLDEITYYKIEELVSQGVDVLLFDLNLLHKKELNLIAAEKVIRFLKEKLDENGILINNK